MAIEITDKIIAYDIVDAADSEASVEESGETMVAEQHEHAGAEIIQMHEKLERPEMLLGSTYKIKTPLSDHALYVTINDVLLNAGTEHEMRRPYEIFINSKNMDHFQWIVALTRIISAVFRKGGDVTFLADELRSVFDPQGGYFKKGGKYMPSLVAEIGDAIEAHMRMTGMIEPAGLDEQQRQHLDAKRREYESIHEREEQPAADSTVAEYPAGSELCAKCQTRAVIRMDGCKTCLSCGDSKCG